MDNYDKRYYEALIEQLDEYKKEYKRLEKMLIYDSEMVSIAVMIAYTVRTIRNIERKT